MPAVRALFAEYLGTLLIVTTVLGAGHMVAALDAEPALGLIIIAICVGGVLFGAISAFGPVSGAHFNPVVSLVFFLRRELSLTGLLAYTLAQVLGAVSGALVANLMFEKQPLVLSGVERSGAGIWLGEFVATFGLVLLILLLIARSPQLVAAGVALWIVAGHVFTSSTSFANPAVSIGRMLSDAPSSISPGSVPGYLAMQLLGALAAFFVAKLFTEKKEEHV
jgi:glycerol uptake facilitator-like aquaporin